MSQTDFIPVKYIRNADDTVGTGGLSFPDDDRPNLLIGQVGLVTPDEFNRYGSFGVILESADKADVPDEVTRAAYGQDEQNLEDLNKSELQSILDAEGVEYKASDTQAQLVDAVRAVRAGTDVEGAASLPATATVGTGAPAPAGSSLAAGPGGAAAGPGIGGGPASTSGGGA